MSVESWLGEMRVGLDAAKASRGGDAALWRDGQLMYAEGIVQRWLTETDEPTVTLTKPALRDLLATVQAARDGFVSKMPNELPAE